jgi:hypothetical protein
MTVINFIVGHQGSYFLGSKIITATSGQLARLGCGCPTVRHHVRPYGMTTKPSAATINKLAFWAVFLKSHIDASIHFSATRWTTTLSLDSLKKRYVFHLRGLNLTLIFTQPSGKYSIQSQGLCYCKILVFACNDFRPIKPYLSSQSFPGEPEAGEVRI